MAQQQPQVIVVRKTGCLGKFVALVLIGGLCLVVGMCALMGKVASDASKSGATAQPAAHKTETAKPTKTETAARPSAANPTKTETAEQPPAKEAPKVHKIKDTVSVGYTSYCVWKANWQSSIGSGFLVQKPNAAFLILNITVRNDDKKARTVPPLKLIDENGAEYDAASAAMMQGEGWFNVLEDLNPSVSKQGNIAFDVPQGHNYKLKVSGGFWSTDSALIDIVTK